MAFLTFTAGQVLTAAAMNTMSQQSVSIVTTATRPASPTTGQSIYDTTVGAMFTWSGSAWVPADHLRMLNTASALVGTAPSVSGSTRWMMQAGTVVGTTSAFGVYAVTFPTAFPNGVLTVVTNNGDNTGPTTTYVYSYSTSSFAVVFPGYNSVPARCNYIAIGW